jgi:hypothetical protein
MSVKPKNLGPAEAAAPAAAAEADVCTRHMQHNDILQPQVGQAW